MRPLVLTKRHAAAYRVYAEFVTALDQRLALRRAGRPDRQRAARKGVATKRANPSHPRAGSGAPQGE